MTKEKKNDLKYAFGVTSQCNDGLHVYMGDVDKKTSFIYVLKYAKRIISSYNLSHMYIIKSTNGYNLICLDKMKLYNVYKINKSFNFIDPVFNDLAYNKRGFYVLRFGCDKIFIELVLPPIYKDTSDFHKSNAHRIFLNWFFDLDIDKSIGFDDYENIKIIKFLNRKYGVKV